MSTHVNGKFVLALVGLLALDGCAADTGESDGRAAGGYTSVIGGSTGGTGGATTPAGRSGGAGGPGFITAGSAGRTEAAGSGGAAGASGIGGTSGRSQGTDAGSAGVTRGGAGGASGDTGGLLGIPTDPKCASIKPIDGTSCDAQGPIVCPLGSKQCVCFKPDGGASVWSCPELGIGIGSSGGGGDMMGFARGGSSAGDLQGNGRGGFGLGSSGSSSGFEFGGTFARN